MKTNTYPLPKSWQPKHKILVFIFNLILFLSIRQWWIERNYPTTKSDFAKWYGVDKKTFNKWIKHFCNEIYPDLKVYQRKRILPKKEVKAIIDIIGTPQFYPILSKKEIIKYCDSSYGVLRRCVYAFPEGFGVTATSFKAVQKFPPKISRQIMVHFDPDRIELVLNKKHLSANRDDLTTYRKKS